MVTNGGAKDGEYTYKGGRTSLSTRGSRALAPFSPYIKAVNDAKKNPWSLANPNGYFVVPFSPFLSFSHPQFFASCIMACIGLLVMVWGDGNAP
jgi:hypothetical protein